MTQTTLFPLKAMGAEGGNKKGPTSPGRGRPFIVPFSRSDQESQALQITLKSCFPCQAGKAALFTDKLCGDLIFSRVYASYEW